MRKDGRDRIDRPRYPCGPDQTPPACSDKLATAVADYWGILITSADDKAVIQAQRREVMTELGSILKTWRGEDQIQQQELARLACVSPTVIRRIEAGTYESPPPPKLIEAVQQLGGPAADLARLGSRYRVVQRRQRETETLAQAVQHGRTTSALPPGLRRRQLPVLPPALVGRDELIRSLTDALARNRLVSLVGPAGVGKTALASESVRAAEARGGLALFVDLTAIPSGSERVDEFALRELLEDVTTGQAPSIADLAMLMEERDCLLVIDNCEHVSKAAAGFITDLLETIPTCTVLATSREPLRRSNEFILTVDPLHVPETATPAEGPLGRATSLELFEGLIMRARGGRALTEGERPHALKVCEALDGMPLALEIAASRARSIPLDAIRKSVESGLHLLEQADPSGSRHAGVASALVWSWELLGEEEQRSLARLAACGSPMSYECAVFVAGYQGSGEQQVADLLERSLLSTVETEDGGIRYRLLHVVRMFVASTASEDDVATGRRRLLEWLERLSEVDELAQQQEDVSRTLDQEMSLIAAALRDFAADERAICFRICLNLWQVLRVRGYGNLGIPQLEAAWDQAFDIPDAMRGRAFGAMAALLGSVERDREALAAAEESTRIRRLVGDPTTLRWALIGLATACEALGDFDRAQAAVSEARGLPGEMDGVTDGDLCAAQGVLSMRRGEAQEAVGMLQTGAQLLRTDAPWSAAHALRWLSLAHMNAGDVDAATRVANEAVAVSERTSETLWVQCRLMLATCFVLNEQRQDALALLDLILGEAESVAPDSDFQATMLRVRAASSQSAEAAGNLLQQALLSELPAGSYWADAALWLLGAAHDVAAYSGDEKGAAELSGLDLAIRREHLGVAAPVTLSSVPARRRVQPAPVDYDGVRGAVRGLLPASAN